VSWPKLQKGIFSGIHLMDPAALKNYPNHNPGCIVRNIYQPLLAHKKLLQAYLHSGLWWDLGSIDQLKSVDQGLWNQTIDEPILKEWEEIRRWAKPLFHRSQ
jgi:NDP-sugar pyrophosphorylase family protein